MMPDLDPQLTFDAFVVGPANRLAAAAARRAADSPGKAYNPLFVYAGSGLGKSHMLVAMAHHATRNRSELRVLYQTVEGFLDDVASALEKGDKDAARERYRDLDLLLLDDVQFLAGQTEAQEILLRSLDALHASGGQSVLASDRPPSEMNGLDSRLLSRFSGGLIVDIAPPEYETRVAIVRRKVEEREGSLAPGVAEALARVPLRNVREMGGALNRVLAIQDLEGRTVAADEIPALFQRREEPAPALRGSAPAAEAPVADEPWRRALESAAEAAESDGFSTERLRRYLDGSRPPPDPEALVEAFQRDLQRLREVTAELNRVGNPWPEAAWGVLNNPDRLEEAESLLSSARERQRPFPAIPPGPDLDALGEEFPALAVGAAQQMATGDRVEYNPLYLWSPRGSAAREVAEAAGRSYAGARPRSRVALVTAAEFGEEYIKALSSGVAGAWRERWWTVELLILVGAQALSEMERAQDEFFHLFEALKRRGARIVVAADRAPGSIQGVEERLRSRFEGGLVVELDLQRPEPRTQAARRAPAGTESRRPGAGPARGPEPAPPRRPAPGKEVPFRPPGKADAGGRPPAREGQRAARLFPPEFWDGAERTVDDEAGTVPDAPPATPGGPPAGPSPPASAGGTRPRAAAPARGAAPEARGPAPPASRPAPADEATWAPSPESVVWDWPLAERIHEEMD